MFHCKPPRGCPVPVRRLVLPVVLAALFVSSASAQESLKESTSLRFAPADAAFYMSSLRNREKYDAVVNSNAFARLREMPAVQSLEQQLAIVQFMLASPDAQDGLKLLGDMFSHEVFIYGDESWIDFVQLANQINSAMRFSQIQDGAEDPTMKQGRAIFRALDAKQEELAVPEMVIGFKLENTDHAQAQLKKLEMILQMQLGTNPDLAKRFERRTVGDHEYLTLEVDGSMIPWEEVPIKAMEEREGEFDALVEKITGMTVTVALGVREDHLLLALGKSTEHLKTLGSGELLYDRDEFAPLRKHADRRISGITYSSQAFMKQVGNVRNQLNDLLNLADMLRMQDIPEEQITALKADLKEWIESAEGMLPEPGATLSFDFMTERGFEGYTYNWSKNKLYDGSRSLPILNHVGGSPVGFYAARGRYSPENYELLVEFFKLAGKHAEKIALDMPNVSEQEREEYQKFRKALLPLLKQLDEVTRSKLMPSLKDGQGAFVFDMKLKSSQWHPLLPASDAQLALPEIAFVYGVSDAKLLKAAFSDYFEIAQQVADKLHELKPREVPETKLPAPQVSEAAGGTVYEYPFAAAVGLDPKFSPNAAVSETTAVLSLSRDHSERLLKSQTPALKEGPLAARREKPLAAAAMFDWPALVDGIKPWVEYGVEYWMGMQAINAGQADHPSGGARQQATAQLDPLADILDQIETGAEILKCWRGFSSATYIEEGVTVTHRESVWRDLP